MKVCIVDGLHGIYVPKRFSTLHGDSWGVDPEDKLVLEAGPDHAAYWEIWDDVLGYATYTDDQGQVWRLHQDGDLFAYTGEWEDD